MPWVAGMARGVSQGTLSGERRSDLGTLTSGSMPDITPPQFVAMGIAGIPILAELLRAFGVYDLSLEQQEALQNAVTWAGVVAAALIGGDAILRTGRNARRGKVEAALAEGGEGDRLEIVQRSLTPTVPPGTSSQASSTAGFEEPPPPR